MHKGLTKYSLTALGLSEIGAEHLAVLSYINVDLLISSSSQKLII